jgi:hypothetical protein
MNIHRTDPASYSLPHVKHINCGDIVNLLQRSCFSYICDHRKKICDHKKQISPGSGVSQTGGTVFDA